MTSQPSPYLGLPPHRARGLPELEFEMYGELVTFFGHQEQQPPVLHENVTPAAVWLEIDADPAVSADLEGTDTHLRLPFASERIGPIIKICRLTQPRKGQDIIAWRLPKF